MNKLSWAALTLTALIALLLSWSLACADDTGFGVLQGTVKFTDGHPYGGAQVAIVVNGTPLKKPLLTDDTGEYSAVVPAGDAVITVEGTVKKVTLTAGAQSTVDFTVKQIGVIVSAVFGDATMPNNLTLTGAYKAPEGDAQNLSPLVMGNGRYFFKTVPADATAFAVIAQQPGDNAPTLMRHQWTFAKQEDLRDVTLTLSKPVAVSLLVVDADGKPITNAQVKGTLNFPTNSVTFWGDAAAPGMPQPSGVVDLNGRGTDNAGLLPLGALPPNSYTISLRVNKLAGKTQTFTIGAEGAPQPLKYALDLKARDVTQTLFGADGAIAPHTAVIATYCWSDQVIYVHATSDEKGLVIWHQLPPVSVLVWGDTVPLGCMAADATTVTTPLPAPPTNNNGRNWMTIMLKLTKVGPQPTSVLYSVSQNNNGYPNRMNTNEFPYQPQPADTEQSLAIPFPLQVTAGGSFSLVAATTATAPRLLCLANYYAPLMDTQENPQENQPTLTIAMSPATLIAGKLTYNNTPVPGVSQFRMAPLDSAQPILQQMPDDMKRRLHMLAPKMNPDGTFTATVPGAGSYRFFVDLYDEQTPLLPSLRVDVPAEGKTDIELQLPAPLNTKMTPGTEVRWISKCAPCLMKSLIVAATATPMQLFGPREQLLAFWYNPTPDQLILWTNKTPQPQPVTLRSAMFTLAGEANGRMMMPDSALSALLPVSNAAQEAPAAKSDRLATPLFPGANDLMPIWPGTYLLGGSPGMGRGRFAGVGAHYTLVNVPATGPVTINVQTPPTPMNNGMGQQQQRPVQIKQAKAIEPNNNNQNTTLYIAYNNGDWDTNGNNISSWNLQNGNGNIWVPFTAKSFTLYWPGIGYVKNVAIPAGDNPSITLPDWEKGVSVSGTILQPDGHPYANGQVIISSFPNMDQNNDVVRHTTDANGAFSANGLFPGTVYIGLSNRFNGGNGNQFDGVWTLAVPATGVKDRTLRISANPTRIQLPNMNNRMQNWWIPDHGAPVLLPGRWNNCVLYDFAGGTGALWSVSGANWGSSIGDASYQRTTLSPGNNTLSNPVWNGNGRAVANAAAICPALGLYFPLDPAHSLPGTVQLIGLEERAFINVTFANLSWLPSAAVDHVVAQINAVPPGKYRVIATTENGPAETTATVTDSGGIAEFTYPAAPPAAPARPAGQPVHGGVIDQGDDAN